MSTKIFVNLPVRDLSASIDFFSRLGYSFDPQFTTDDAGCLVISDDICVLLQTREHFQTFTSKPVADAETSTEAILALSVDSRQQVDELADRALAAGGRPANEPQDQGFLYGRSFQDLDGHQWEVLYLDQAALQRQG